MTDQDLRPRRQRVGTSDGTGRWLWMVLAVAAAGYGGWYAKTYWSEAAQPQLAQPTLSQPMQEPSVTDVASSEGQAVAVPNTFDAEPKYPLPMHTSLADPEVMPDLDTLARTWLGDQALQFLVIPGLAHHIVATVDNLPRAHAAVRLWPVLPVGGRMVLEGDAAHAAHIAPGNSARYDKLVDFLTQVEPVQAVRWYQQAYPQLQQAYEALGYPAQHFNDRLVAVMDHLLQTPPHPEEPLAVRWVQVQGQTPGQQPWLRYELVDPQLQALSAGQRVLLRVGPQHRQRLMEYLAALRAEVTNLR